MSLDPPWLMLVPSGAALLVLGHGGASTGLVGLACAVVGIALAGLVSARVAGPVLTGASIALLLLLPFASALSGPFASPHAFADRVVAASPFPSHLPLLLMGAAVALSLVASLRTPACEPRHTTLFGTRPARLTHGLARGLSTLERYGLESALGFAAGLVRFVANLTAALDAMLLDKPATRLADRLRTKSDHG